MQHSVGMARYEQPRYYPVFPARLTGLETWRDGAAAVVRGALPRPGEEDRESEELTATALRADLRCSRDRSLDVLHELGAHGDAALAFSLPVAASSGLVGSSTWSTGLASASGCG